MNGLYVIFYRDLNTEKTGTEHIYANTSKYAYQQFKSILESKGIQYFYIIRTTKYQKVGSVEL